jgi:hypothetical protein
MPCQDIRSTVEFYSANNRRDFASQHFLSGGALTSTCGLAIISLVTMKSNAYSLRWWKTSSTPYL